MPAWHSILELRDLPDATPKAFAVGDQLVLLLRRGDDVVATQAACPHKFGALEEGRLDGWCLTCPIHAATFDLRTGSALPGGVWSGPLQTYPTRIREGLIEVALPT